MRPPRTRGKGIQMRWDRGKELNIPKQDPEGSSLRWSLGTALRPLATAQRIPVFEPVVVGNSSIDVDCCNDGHDDENDCHACTSLHYTLLLLYRNCIGSGLNLPGAQGNLRNLGMVFTPCFTRVTLAFDGEFGIIIIYTINGARPCRFGTRCRPRLFIDH